MIVIGLIILGILMIAFPEGAVWDFAGELSDETVIQTGLLTVIVGAYAWVIMANINVSLRNMISWIRRR